MGWANSPRNDDPAPDNPSYFQPQTKPRKLRKRSVPRPFFPGEIQTETPASGSGPQRHRRRRLAQGRAHGPGHRLAVSGSPARNLPPSWLPVSFTFEIPGAFSLPLSPSSKMAYVPHSASLCSECSCLHEFPVCGY